MTDVQKFSRYGPVVGRFNSVHDPDHIWEVREKTDADGTVSHSCNCLGWRFRKTCKHVQFVEQSKAMPVATTVPVVKPLSLEEQLADLVLAEIKAQNVGEIRDRIVAVIRKFHRTSMVFLQPKSEPIQNVFLGGVRLITLED
jgi:hypothetical protein